MANPEHTVRLLEGCRAWNEWRERSPEFPDLSGADLSRASLSGANLSRADLSGADLSRANLATANLINADLSDANLCGADLSGSSLYDSMLCRANLSGANLSGSLLHGASLSDANLSGSMLYESNLPSADLSGADLSRANLATANLINADLSDANLSGANLSRADLSGADLSRANLATANLINADLSDANLCGADLSGADLSGAELIEVVFADVDLSKTKGLDACVHRGPSTLDHRSLQRSGSLPEVFLRGCGLPDELITYLPSLHNAGPIQFYSCFISYSTANQDFADRLYADLQAKGVRCWFATHDMRPGQKLHEQIDKAIRDYDRLLLILSHESMSSEWVKTEIARARQKEVALKRRVLFPLALVPFRDVAGWQQFDADIGGDTAKEIREYYLPDFSDWKGNHDAYQQSFDKVIAALKSDK